MSGRRQALLGVFFLATLSMLAYYTLFLTDFNLFREEVQRTVFFDDAAGLRAGDPVLVSGIRTGRVGHLTLDPDAPVGQRVTAVLILEEDLPLREGFTITIRDGSLLGGKMISVDPGPPGGTRVDTGIALYGDTAPSAIDDLGDLVRENRERVSRTLDNLDLMVADLRAGRGLLGRALSEDELADEFTAGVEGFTTTMENAAEISTDLREGRGTLGRLLQDEELAGKVEEIADRAQGLIDELQQFARQAREGQGTIGRLLTDEELADDVARAVDDLAEVARRLREGEGTVGRLLTDETLAEDVQEVVRRLREGEGTVGRLLSEELVYERLDQISADIATITGALRRGDGTLGKLVNDQRLYRDLQVLLGTATRSLEEFREAAPVTTFTQVLFGAF